MRINVDVLLPGGGLAQAQGYLLAWPGGNGSVTYSASTDASGRLSFVVGAKDTLVALRVEAPGHWITRIGGPSFPQTVTLLRLPAGGAKRWWHEILGCGDPDPNAGAGIRVGVVDTAFRAEAGLEHARLVTLSGAPAPPVPTSRPTHGEVVCRLIGQRMDRPRAFGGMAPGAELLGVAVGADGHGLNPVSATEAIYRLAVEERCDLINLSAGRPEEQPGLLAAIQEADRNGALCIVAAGNDGRDQVAFPARYLDCVAVGGIGALGWGPLGSMVRFIADTVQNRPEACGNIGGFGVFHFPNSCHGEGLDVVAPGVGLVICRGETAVAQATGTSFAAPLVVGVLAATLAQDPRYRSMPRDKAKAARARMVLQQICHQTGMSLELEGLGVPRVPPTSRTVAPPKRGP